MQMADTTVPSPLVVRDECWEFSEGKFAQSHPNEADRTYHYIFGFPTVYVISSKKARSHRRDNEYVAYVGETNDIAARTRQHMKADPASREDWRALSERARHDSSSVVQYVIGHPHFNKSLTLDVENRMMQYLLSVDAVKSLNNRRTNPQGDYYPRNELGSIFSKAWRELHRLDPDLFPTEALIRDSAVFKASPFHCLSKEQREAEEQILAAVEEARSMADDGDSEFGKLILVQGAAGTGKTVLISHLFYQLAGDFESSESDEDAKAGPLGPSRPEAFLLINHDEQRHVYNEIARKLNLQNKFDQVVLKPTTFINQRTVWGPSEGKKKNWRGSHPKEKVDVALIDEAHLLLTQSNQAYLGNNMLLDVMRRARVTVAVFDPEQILNSSQQWTASDLDTILGAEQSSPRHFESVRLGESKMFDRKTITLQQQFRIAANDQLIGWIDRLIDDGVVGKIPESRGYFREGHYVDEPYDIRVFDSPVELFRAVSFAARGMGEERGLSRVLATYDWPYSGNRKNETDPDGFWNVELHEGVDGIWRMGLAADDASGIDDLDASADSRRFCHPWNYMLSKQADGKSIGCLCWAENPETLNEIGSTYTIQGFDLNIAGVIIGPSVKYRDGHIVFDAKGSQNSKAVQKRGGEVDYSAQNLRNELNVLLKRGVHGLYLFAVDPELQKALREASR